MKTLFISFIVWLSVIGQKQPNHILIKHIGICDKPIFDILINETDSVTKAINTNEFMLARQNYIDVKHTILSYKDDSKPESDYGSFEIVITDHNKTTSEIYLGRKKAMLLFKSLIDVQREGINETLLLRLRTTIPRIDF